MIIDARIRNASADITTFSLRHEKLSHRLSVRDDFLARYLHGRLYAGYSATYDDISDASFGLSPTPILMGLSPRSYRAFLRYILLRHTDAAAMILFYSANYAAYFSPSLDITY